MSDETKPCSNGFCWLRCEPLVGQHTNGPCNCLRDVPLQQAIKRKITHQQQEIERLTSESRQLTSRLDAVTRDKITAEREVERLTAECDKLRSSMAKWASRWLEMVLDRCGDDPAWRHELMPTLTRLYDSVKK